MAKRFLAILLALLYAPAFAQVSISQLPAINNTATGNETTLVQGGGCVNAQTGNTCQMTLQQISNFLTNGLSINVAQVVGLAPSATTDTTNASNIVSGTLSAARLPATISANTTGTAAALASTPTTCTGSQAAQGITASGNATGCFNAGTPGGSSNQLQYNNASAFGGITNGTQGNALQNGASGAPTFGKPYVYDTGNTTSYWWDYVNSTPFCMGLGPGTSTFPTATDSNLSITFPIGLFECGTNSPTNAFYSGMANSQAIIYANQEFLYLDCLSGGPTCTNIVQSHANSSTAYVGYQIINPQGEQLWLCMTTDTSTGGGDTGCLSNSGGIANPFWSTSGPQAFLYTNENSSNIPFMMTADGSSGAAGYMAFDGSFANRIDYHSVSYHLRYSNTSGDDALSFSVSGSTVTTTIGDNQNSTSPMVVQAGSGSFIKIAGVPEATAGKPTISACGTPTTTGGAEWGHFTAGATSCNPVLTYTPSAANWYICTLNDETTNITFRQTAHAATSATMTASGSATTSDVIEYHCGAH